MRRAASRRVDRFVIATTLMCVWPAAAKEFKNGFISFELPAGWDCKLTDQVWDCQNGDVDKKRDAIIVFAAKKRGEQDSLTAYLSYLRQPKTITDLKGNTVNSKVKFVERRKIGDFECIDAEHEDSEIAGFLTRYIAGLKADIAVLVTYSVRTGAPASAKLELDEVLKTIKVTRGGK